MRFLFYILFNRSIPSKLYLIAELLSFPLYYFTRLFYTHLDLYFEETEGPFLYDILVQ